MKKALISIIGIILLTACVAIPKPTKEQLASADYGPFPESWKELTSSALAAELVRPETLYIRKIEQPRKLWVRTPDDEDIYGWGVCGMLVMGISRLEQFFVLIRDDEVIYEELGFKLAKHLPGKTWFNKKGASYEICKGLYSN